jgi:hypothetical protein
MLTPAATKTKPIDNYDNRQFTTIVNSASTAAPIGLPKKMAEFCHTSNRLLVGHNATVHYGGCILILLRSVGCWLFVGQSTMKTATL